jgi:hypothetical protein
MLEDVGSGSTFTYRANGLEVGAPVDESNLAAIDTVVLHLEPQPLWTAATGSTASTGLTTDARVGR